MNFSKVALQERRQLDLGIFKIRLHISKPRIQTDKIERKTEFEIQMWEFKEGGINNTKAGFFIYRRITWTFENKQMAVEFLTSLDYTTCYWTRR